MLTTIVLSHNSEASLARTLESVKFCDHLIVVDDHSTDTSVEIANRYGAKVVTHDLNGDYAAHHNWAITQAKQSDWILLLHHDEVVSPELASEILSVLPTSTLNGYFLPRTDIVWNHVFKYGDVWRAKFMRLARPTQGKWIGAIHEVWTISHPTGNLRHPLLHYPHTSVSDFLCAINTYSTIRANELASQHHQPSILEVIFLPPLKFIYNYFLRLGFLDGLPGFVHAGIMAFYTFMVRGKLYLHK